MDSALLCYCWWKAFIQRWYRTECWWRFVKGGSCVLLFKHVLFILSDYFGVYRCVFFYASVEVVEDLCQLTSVSGNKKI